MVEQLLQGKSEQLRSLMRDRENLSLLLRIASCRSEATVMHSIRVFYISSLPYGIRHKFKNRNSHYLSSSYSFSR